MVTSIEKSIICDAFIEHVMFSKSVCRNHQTFFTQYVASIVSDINAFNGIIPLIYHIVQLKIGYVKTEIHTLDPFITTIYWNL